MATSEIHKAAIVLMSLPEEMAVALLARLEPLYVEAVTVEIARCSAITADEQNAAIYEFSDIDPKSIISGKGGPEVAKNLVEKAFGKGHDSLENLRHSIESVPFGFLQNVDSQNLLTFLADEHPQTIALVLCHLPSTYGAEIISGLPPERQLAVIHRVATMGQTSPEIIHEVEQGLERRMSHVMSQQFQKAGGIPTVAEILNVTDRATERGILENLSQDAPELVEEIRRLMFVFEDINKFSNKDVQTVLKNVENSQWALALKGASEELKQKILGNMSQRASELLKEEMEYLGPVRLSAVEQMQQQVVDVVRRLEGAGEISLEISDESEEFIQ